MDNRFHISADDLIDLDYIWSSIYEIETNNNQLPIHGSSSSTQPMGWIQHSPSEEKFLQQGVILDNTTPTLNSDIVIGNINNNQMLASSSLLPPNNSNNDNEKCGWGPDIGQLAGWVPKGTNVVPWMDPMEYQHGLGKAQLELARQAAANAMNWESNFSTQAYVDVAPNNRSQASTVSIPESQVTYAASLLGIPKQQNKDARGPVLILPKPPTFRKIGSHFSRSSGDQSGDYVDRESAMDPTDVRRKRRDSNKASARRSREKKQARLTELEEQVNQLKAENASLLENYNHIRQKYHQFEKIKAEVQMEEERFKRVELLYGIVPLQHNHGLPNIPVQGASTDTPPVDIVQPIAPAYEEPREVIMQRMASLEHLQKQTREGAGSRGTSGA